jgi:hypothetical protein
MAEIIATINRTMAEGGITYIHCWDAVGHTGLAVACWLQERGQTPDDALRDLADKWRSCAKYQSKPSSLETAEQVRWVKEWPLHRSRLHLRMTHDRYRGAAGENSQDCSVRGKEYMNGLADFQSASIYSL